MPSLPVLPLKDTVVYPQLVSALSVGRPKSLAAVNCALEGSREILTVAQRTPDEEVPGLEDLYPIGSVATINRVEKHDRGAQIIVLGERRVRLLGVAEDSDQLVGEFEELPLLDMGQAGEDKPKVEALLQENSNLSLRIATTMDRENGPQIYQQMVGSIPNPISRMYRIASLASSATLDKEQEALEADTPLELMEILHGVLNMEMQVTELRQQIAEQAGQEIEQQQREHVLRQQKRAIEQALGEAHDDADIGELKA